MAIVSSEKKNIVIFHILNLGGLLVNVNNTLLFLAHAQASVDTFKGMGFFEAEAPNLYPGVKFSSKHLVCCILLLLVHYNPKKAFKKTIVEVDKVDRLGVNIQN